MIPACVVAGGATLAHELGCMMELAATGVAEDCTAVEVSEAAALRAVVFVATDVLVVIERADKADVRVTFRAETEAETRVVFRAETEDSPGIAAPNELAAAAGVADTGVASTVTVV